MNKTASKTASIWAYAAAAIAGLGVLIHLGALWGGVSWYVFFGAPPFVVQSVRDGSWLAPISTLAIAMAMGLCGLYALSALGHLRRLPLLRLGLVTMATVCLLRALVLLPLAISHPELRNTFEVTAALVWGLAGIGFAQASLLARRG